MREVPGSRHALARFSSPCLHPLPCKWVNFVSMAVLRQKFSYGNQKLVLTPYCVQRPAALVFVPRGCKDTTIGTVNLLAKWSEDRNRPAYLTTMWLRMAPLLEFLPDARFLVCDSISFPSQNEWPEIVSYSAPTIMCAAATSFTQVH